MCENVATAEGVLNWLERITIIPLHHCSIITMLRRRYTMPSEYQARQPCLSMSDPKKNPAITEQQFGVVDIRLQVRPRARAALAGSRLIMLL